MTPDEARPVIEAACMAAGVEVAHILEDKATRDAEAKAARAAIIQEFRAAGLTYRAVGVILGRNPKSRSAELLTADRNDAPTVFDAAAVAARAEIRRIQNPFCPPEPEPKKQKRRDPSLFWEVRNGELRLCGPVERLAEIAEKNRRASKKAARHGASPADA